MRSRRPKFKLRHVEDALTRGAGVISAAAQILNCAPNTVRNYIARHPRLNQVIDEAVELNLDLAESKLISAIDKGDLIAVKFYLETKGKHRGYTRRSEITGPAGQPIEVTDARRWLADTLDQMADRLRPVDNGTPGDPRPGGTQPPVTVH